MRVLLVSALSAFVLSACVANDETDNGTPIKLEETTQYTLEDSILLLPETALQKVEDYQRLLRNNEHPIEVIRFEHGGRMQGQYLRGFYSAFAREVAQEILSEEYFLEWAMSRGVDDYELNDIHAFGSDYGLNGGHYALFERGKFHCIAARSRGRFRSTGIGDGGPWLTLQRDHRPKLLWDVGSPRGDDFLCPKPQTG